MKPRTRNYYSEAEKTKMWDRWQAGESMHDIARSYGRSHSSFQRILTVNGGFRPPPRTRSSRSLSLEERETISRHLACGSSIRSIAAELGRSPSTISREIRRNGGDASYRAHRADQAAWERAKRPKPCKLQGRARLIRAISSKLQQQWSPEQIAGWLKRKHPDNEYFHVSHETIYKSLFIQARGVLKKELMVHLRRERTSRRPQRHTLKNKGLGQISDAITIRERPASVEDRAVPGHWEGDLLEGSGGSAMATLVERTSRFTMLVKVQGKDTTGVTTALARQVRTLPAELRSLRE